MASNTKASKLKRAWKLNGLTDAVDFTRKKNFEKYEEESGEKDKVIKELWGQIPIPRNHLENLETKIEGQKQYSRRKYILEHRKNESEGEDTDELVLQTFINEVKFDIKLEQTDRPHKIGSSKKDCGNKKSRPKIVKFIRCADRRNIFSDKKNV